MATKSDAPPPGDAPRAEEESPARKSTPAPAPAPARPPSRAPAPARPPSLAPAPAPPPPPYEFSDTHKESFRALGASMSFVGVCTMLFSVLAGVFALGEVVMGFVPNALGTAVSAGLDGVLAWWMLSAGRSLSGLVRTHGRDIEQLMDAVVQLRRLFGLARVLIILLAMAVTLGGALVVYCNFVVERGGKCFGAFG